MFKKTILIQWLTACAAASSAGLFATAVDASPTPNCTPKIWSVAKDALTKDDLVAYVKAESAREAVRTARYELGKTLASRFGRELLDLPSVRKTLNLKAYARADYLAALPAAWAFDLKSARRVAGETACGGYAAVYAITKAQALQDVGGETGFPDHLNLALLGGARLTELEKKREAKADADAEAAAKPTQPQVKDLAALELTAARVKKSAELLDPGSIAEGLFVAPMRSRFSALTNAIKSVRAAPADQRGTALKAAAGLARDDEKWVTALKDLRAQEFIIAFDSFMAFARDGDADAQTLIGYFYMEARGVKRDYREALQWLKRGANNGNGPAKMMIAMLYFAGKGVRVDHDEAFRWAKSAANDGWSCDAQITMCRQRSDGTTE